MKILWFVDNDKKRWIIWKIKDKYYQFYKIFFDYFNETILKNSFFNESNWNYLNFSKNDNKDLFFFTNNVRESSNWIFNSHAIYNWKSFYTFKKCILETLEYF